LDWESLFKRYVWDTQTTPYFTAVPRLTRVQANFEVLAFCLFFGILFAVVALGALTDKALFGRSPLLGLYAFSVVAACVIFNYTKALPAAAYLAAAPIACIVYVGVYGFGDPELRLDSIIVGGFLLLVALYTPRLVAISRTYPEMPEGDAPPRRRRLFK
jgi:hypothetical protein